MALPIEQNEAANVDNELDNDDQVPMDIDRDDEEGNVENMSPREQYDHFHCQYQRTFYNFVIKCKEEYGFPVNSVHNLVDDVQGLLETFQFSFCDIVKKQLQIDPAPQALDYMLSDDDFFQVLCQGSKSDNAIGHMLAQRYPYSPPIELKLGESESGTKDIMHVISLKQTLVNILSNNDILSEIMTHLRQRKNVAEEHNDKLYDIRVNFSDDNVTDIPLMFYIDEFNPCNPIGSRKKHHKLSGMYFSIISLPPAIRSKLKSIFLYGLAYESLVKKYGYDKVLERLISELQELNQDDLEVVLPSGETHRFRVWLHMVSADNLSAHDILGLQRNFNHGKISRYCLIDYDNISGSSDYTQCPVRTLEGYDLNIAQLEDNPQLAKQEYGITGKCVFNDLPDIDVTKLCPPDCLHDIMEGCIPIVICVALRDIISTTNLTIQHLNDILISFKYGATDIRNKFGSSFTMAQLRSNTFAGTASEKLCLLRMLPLMLRSYIESAMIPKGLTLIHKMLDVTDIVMGFVINKEWLAGLHMDIIELHELVVELAPTAITPKFHFLAHYPELIEIYGPPRHYYTMRFEAQHQYFKRLTHKSRNFINLTLTLTTRFQRRQAFSLNQKDYYTKCSVVSSGSSRALSTMNHTLIDFIKEEYPNMPDDENIYCCTHVEIHEVTYKTNNVLVWKLEAGFLEIPTFLLISSNILIRSKWFVYAKELRTVGYDELLHAYEVADDVGYHHLIEPGSEADHTPLSLYVVNNKSIISPRYRITKNVSYFDSNTVFFLSVGILTSIMSGFIVCNSDKTVRKVVAASNYDELITKGQLGKTFNVYLTPALYLTPGS